jgi:carbamoyltransferase
MALWIAGITRGHNAGVCLLKDGEIVFALEEERLSRQKYDGGPYASMIKILEYTDRLDYIVIAHTQPLKESAGQVDFTGEDVYTGLARKLGLIDRKADLQNHPQVVDMSFIHHKLHAACAFYRSGFKEATALIVDGAGTFIPMVLNNSIPNPQSDMTWELESIFTCKYPNNFKTIYKHQGGRGPFTALHFLEISSKREGENGTHELIVDETAGIVKAYEAVTQYCGWPPIEAGKTMGLFPYGKPNLKIPKIYDDGGGGTWRTANRNLIIPTYPNGAVVNQLRYEELKTPIEIYENKEDITLLQNRRDLAYAVQTQSQAEVLNLIRKAVDKTGNKNVVLSGGYGLNCVANYFYLDQLKDEGINLYVEPISNDAGTCIGAALLMHYTITKDKNIKPYAESLYLGPEYTYTDEEIEAVAEKYSAEIYSADNKLIVELLRNRHIVTLFQGRSESGPRALGNRSILFDPTFADGKDFVNMVKHREYFRPFAGSILYEHAHNWFDLRGMDQSPHMMYAVNCQPGVEEKIPSIIHIDGTCRIQTVKRNQNPHYYDLINEFYQATGIPILFNTSFNLGGEPLVETLDDAVRTLANSLMEYLYLPEYEIIIVVKNKGESNAEI